jgi:hypothetical protein
MREQGFTVGEETVTRDTGVYGMPDFGGLVNKAKDLAGQHQDQVQDGVEKGEDLAKDKLGGKFGDQVEQGGDAVENFLGVDGQTDDQQNDQQNEQR